VSITITEGEALLRQRLLPCQQIDLTKNGGFNVRGSNLQVWAHRFEGYACVGYRTNQIPTAYEGTI